mgnify:CR=1 FL=1
MVDYKRFLDSPANFTFLLTFLVLFCSTFMTALEVVYLKRSDKNPSVSYLGSALMAETGVNAVAGLFYYIFLQIALSSDGPAAMQTINNLRSMDWLVTTPLMLASLMYYYMYYDYGTECNTSSPDAGLCSNYQLRPGLAGVATEGRGWSITAIIALNVLMIVIGSPWLEIPGMTQVVRFAAASACFAGVVYLLYDNFYKDSQTRRKDEVSLFFLVTWGLYPVVRAMQLGSVPGTETMYNLLDMVSKGGFGIIIWLVLQDIQGECKNNCI